MARRSELRNLEALESYYQELLFQQLERCADGAWGLLAANPSYPGERVSESIETLLRAGDQITEARERLGIEPFEPHARLVRERRLRDGNLPGEPKRAQAWLAELHAKMTAAEVERLARGWIAWAAEAWDRPAGGASELDAFGDRLFDLTMTDAGEAMRVCAAIAERTKDEHVLCLLGAGPLETVLFFYKERVIDAFLREAKANPRFRDALRHVWPQAGETQPHWVAFQAVRDRLELGGAEAGRDPRSRRRRD